MDYSLRGISKKSLAQYTSQWNPIDANGLHYIPGCGGLFCFDVFKDFSTTPNDSLVYFIGDGEAMKIGVSKVVENRVKSIQTGNPRKVRILWVMKPVSMNAYDAEASLHRRLSEYRLEGEWFALDGFRSLEIMNSRFIEEIYEKPMSDLKTRLILRDSQFKKQHVIRNILGRFLNVVTTYATEQ